MKPYYEIRQLEKWLKAEKLRGWVLWLQPIIAANKQRLKELKKIK